jgi:predicted pyridoxine 5'-phosphate oxidase superfamily flavin-nucleotide-binding protein
VAYDFLDLMSTSGVRAAQSANGSNALWNHFKGQRESSRFTAAEREFIAARDSFYMATVAENGWPYIQHRGGPAGFLRVLDERTLGFADFRGNRQYISVGNLSSSEKVALILLDYPRKARLKILAHGEIRDLKQDEWLASKLALPGYKARPERALVLHLQAFDWNCPQHITPRYSEAEIEASLAPVRDRLARLEAENTSLREQLKRVDARSAPGLTEA